MPCSRLKERWSRMDFGINCNKKPGIPGFLESKVVVCWFIGAVCFIQDDFKFRRSPNYIQPQDRFYFLLRINQFIPKNIQ